MFNVTALIVNYNTAELVCQCISSLKQQQDICLQIIVLDNNSQDDSISKIQAQHPDIELIASPHNLGFGAGNNQAFRQAKHETILLFNPDAQFAHPKDLSHLCHYLKAHPEHGLIGAQILRSDHHISTAYEQYPEHQHLKEEYMTLPGKIAWVIGACMLLPKTVYQQVGGFDEDYFLYGEETDFCLRIRQAGYSIGHCSSVTVKHVGGASEDKSSQYQVSLRKQKALQLFMAKHAQPQLMASRLRKLKWRARFRQMIHLLRTPCSPSKHRLKAEHYQAIADAVNYYFKQESLKSRQVS